jgi:hypothetical protein
LMPCDRAQNAPNFVLYHMASTLLKSLGSSRKKRKIYLEKHKWLKSEIERKKFEESLLSFGHYPIWDNN